MDMPPRLTVCGAGAAGLAIAADNALKGLAVTLFELPTLAEKLSSARERGGIEVTADSETTAGKTGFARLARVTSDPAEALADADVIMITVPAMYHDAFMDAIAPHLTDGQIVLFNTGYWASLRQARRLGDGLPDVTLAESNIMPYICQPRGDAIAIGRFKRHFCVAAFPGDRSQAVFDVVGRIYSQYDPATSVLDTNIAAAGNPPIHVTLTIPIAGFYFDRYMGGKFYQDATVPGARLVDAFDAERECLSQHLGSDLFEAEFDFDKRSYLYDGKDISEALRSSPHADWFATAAYLEQVCSEDIIYAFVPMVRLGEALGVELPVTRAMVDIMGVMLQRDYWAEGLDLAALGLAGLDLAGIRRFVMTGQA
ncbi:MAG: NAD/NADP octopine/nopaline dehydrogenase family protein [Actinobacteria bacterium]|nr:NAD/NADP octopine/nopaline dehydrogenase family protein [Actinomycetota bacterium]